jgi:hypothetical protein
MNPLSRVILAGAIALSLSPMVSAQSAEGVAMAASAPGMRGGAAEIEIRARIVEIDKADRKVMLRGPKGNIVTVDVPASVKNFDQMSVGDDVVVRHLAAVVAVLEPMAKRTGIRERIEATETAQAPAGGMPGAAQTRTVEILAIIQSLDRKKNQVTLRGAKRTVTVDVPPSVDIKKLKVDDEVRVVFTEATVISVQSAAPAAAPASAAKPAAAASKS